MILRGDVKSENSKLTFSAATGLGMSMSMIAKMMMGIELREKRDVNFLIFTR